MDGYVKLDTWQVVLAAFLIIVNGVISIFFRLRMERSLVIASLRTVIQLSLVGVVLESVFRLDRWYLVISLGLLMTIIAGITAASRSKRKYTGIRLNTFVSVWTSSWLVTGYALVGILQGAENWYQPQYAIPLLGMVLGNTLNGISIGLNSFTESLVTNRGRVEMLFALGATRWEAASEPIQAAIKNGMIPIINAMSVVGIVSLPGMMTGQLVTGMEPAEAVKYQIVIMFLIASATALGTVSVVLLSFLRLFNSEHQFLYRNLT